MSSSVRPLYWQCLSLEIAWLSALFYTPVSNMCGWHRQIHSFKGVSTSFFIYGVSYHTSFHTPKKQIVQTNSLPKSSWRKWYHMTYNIYYGPSPSPSSVHRIHWFSPKWHPIRYVVHYIWPEPFGFPYGPWSKVVIYIGTMVTFWTQTTLSPIEGSLCSVIPQVVG